MKRKIWALLLVLPLMLLPATTGCKLVTAANTPGVPQYYSQAALILNDFSGVLVQSQTLLTSAHASGLVNNADYGNAMRAFAAIATNADGVTSLVKAEAGQTQIMASISALITQVGSMPATFHVSNPNSQAEFTALFQSMQAILQAASTVVQTTQTTK